jgi:hypothetical protein
MRQGENFGVLEILTIDKLNILVPKNIGAKKYVLQNEKSSIVSKLSMVSNHKYYSFQCNI